jgi:hypothetical protein
MSSVTLASLGDAQASVMADARRLQGTVVASTHLHYTMQEITTSSGLLVREYVNDSGMVFAVGWSGPVMPELAGLLGSHHVQYAEAVAAQTPVGVHRTLNIVLPGLVVQSGGHLRAYAGRAYLPQQLPADVSAQELQ